MVKFIFPSCCFKKCGIFINRAVSGAEQLIFSVVSVRHGVFTLAETGTGGQGPGTNGVYVTVCKLSVPVLLTNSTVAWL